MGVRFGRYELLRQLGRGGMAEVFLARYVGPQGFEKQLVIKRVLPQLGADRRFLRLFFDEARTHVSLTHGNLVPVFDFGRVGNAYFIAMEHVRGCDLGTLLGAGHKRGATLPPLLVAHIGIELCRGLAYVHRRGFVHRDVSPRNVLLSADGEVKLSDFGVALAAASDAAPGLRGTLAYMAPEQARGERPDGRADLFALGVVLAEALRGRRVRAHADDAAALAAARAGEPITVEGPLAAVIARATQTAPEARFADADAMLLALEQEAAALGRVGGGAVRELAARLAEWVAPDGEDAGSAGTAAAAATAATMGEETYFRDRESASFIDEVLEEPGEAAPRSRARRWIAAGLVVASAVGLLIVGRAVQSARRQGHVEPAPSPAPKVSSSPISPLALPPPTAPTQASPTATPPTPTAAKSAPSHHAPTRKPAAAGTLIVQCTPWCIPSIDGEVRGADGRNHHLSLAAGTHRVSARRLDDHQERTVEIRPAEAQTIVFTFD